MFIKPSHMLVAAMAVIAAPAFAQDAAETTTEEITSPLSAGADAAAAEAEKAGDAASEAVNNAAQSTSDAAKEAAAAVEEAMPAEEQAPAEEPAAEASAEGEAATPEAETTAAPEGAATSAEGEATSADGETAPAEGETTPAEGTTAPADNADASDAASGDPKPGQYYAKSEHQDWTIRCIKADKGVDPCQLYQLMKDEQGNSVAEMIMIPLNNGDVAAGATVIAPLETDLIKGLSLSIDGGEARGYPFSFCTPVGCVSRMGFTAAELSALKRGGGAQIALLPFGADPSKPVALKLSLSGFTAAFDELSKIAEQTPEAETQEEAPAEEAAPAE